MPRRPLEDARLAITKLSPKKLGLAETFKEICKSAIELAGGKVDLVSEPGNGSTFRVFLPCVATGI